MNSLIEHEIIGSQKHVHKYDLTDFKGRVFLSTDIHGCFDLLQEKLRDHAFNTEKDLLILAGDSTDRGEYSSMAYHYLTEDWCISVKGNHEQMAIDYDTIGDEQCFNMLACNGGGWFIEESLGNQHKIANLFSELPLAIELHLPDGSKVGVIHAEVPYNDWQLFLSVTNAEYNYNCQSHALWSRRNYYNETLEVKGIDRVYCGHTPTDSGEVELKGNRYYCDLGGFFRNKISFVQLM